MKKRNILRSLAIVAVLGSPSATAVELSFGFPIELTQGTCGGLLSCGPFGQIYQAAVFVTLNVMDPLSNQSWTYAAGGVSYALTAPFPIMAPPLRAPRFARKEPIPTRRQQGLPMQVLTSTVSV